MNQEKLDLEVMLRCVARYITERYPLYHAQSGAATYNYSNPDGSERANYTVVHRTTLDLNQDMIWLHETLHSEAEDYPLIETWFRQFEMWRNK